MLNSKVFHIHQSIRRCPRRYLRYLLLSIILTSIFTFVKITQRKIFSTEEKILNPTTKEEYDNKKTEDSKQLLSFDDILGKPNLNQNNDNQVKKASEDILFFIQSVNLSDSHKEQLKQCYIYFDSLNEDVFSNFKILKNSFGAETDHLYQEMAHIIRSYEHCKELDYSDFIIDGDNKDFYKYTGVNKESEIFKYKLVWNYIMNSWFSSSFEAQIYEFLHPEFIEKNINKWDLSLPDIQQYEKISLNKSSKRLTDFENLQYILKGENFLYEYNFDENLKKEKQLSYMGKFLSFDIDINDILLSKTALYNDFAEQLEIVNLKFDNSIDQEKERVGIILTMGSRHINILSKYLAALNYHIKQDNENKNEYHLQIIFNDIEKEFNANSNDIKTKEQIIKEHLKPKLQPYLNDLKISILEVGGILNCMKETEDNFKYFMNKWIAINFNQFNKFMFTDIDLTLFEHPDHFFSLEEKIHKIHDSSSTLANLYSKYKPLDVNKAIPMVLLPDRALKERTFAQCTRNFKNMLPTTKQRYDFKTFKSLSVPTLSQLDSLNPTVSLVFQNFFDSDIRKLHNIDSSLIIINNYNDVSSPLMFSSLLNFIGLDKCVYGDKEFLLLGMIYLGRFDLTVLGLNTGMVAGEEKLDNIFCATQSVQVFNGKVLSINGGLRKCKIDPVSYAIDKDLEFENKVNWLKDYYSISDVDLLKEELEIDYMREIDIDIIIEANPDFECKLSKDYNDKDGDNVYWLRSAFCMEYGYCLDLSKEKDQNRYLIKNIDPKTSAQYKNIVSLWNAN